MTVRSAVAIASLTLAVAASAACVSFFEIGIETPIQAKLDTSPFQRVLVHGFVSGGSKDVDVNSETVRFAIESLCCSAPGFLYNPRAESSEAK